MTEIHQLDPPAKEPSWQAFVNVLEATPSETFDLLAEVRRDEYYRPMLKPLFHSLAKLRPELLAYGASKDVRPPTFDAWFEVLTHLLQQHAKAPALADDFSDVHEHLTYAEPQQPGVWHVELDDAQRAMLMQLCLCMGNLSMELIAYGEAVNAPYFMQYPDKRRKAA